jgi:hypothetical protein
VLFKHVGLKVDARCPRWVKDFSRRFYTSFGLTSWTIQVELNAKMLDERETQGLTGFDPEYKQAHIYLHPELMEDNPANRQILIHEWMHIVMGQEVEAVVSQLRGTGLLPKRHPFMKAFEAMYEPMVERLIQTIALGMQRMGVR